MRALANTKSGLQLHKLRLRETAATILIGSAVAFSLPSAAFAQDSAQPAAEEADAQPEIVVTGSNIRTRNANVTSSASVTQVGAEILQNTASISVEDSLNRIPSITSGLSASSNNNSTGGGSANIGVATTALRNLDPARTLVLVNGRRYVSGVSANSGYGVDLNSIPTAIISRVDVLTGGQSAIYGSDAIAGVVNIITKRNFSGFEANAFRSGSEDGGGARTNFDLTYGRTFDFGNVWVSGGWAKQDSLVSSDRPYAANELNFIDTNADGVRDTIGARNGPAHVPGAALFGPGGLSIFGNGSRFNTSQQLLDANFNRLGASDWDNQHTRRFLVAPYERIYVASGMNFDVSDRDQIEFEFNWAKTTSFVAIEPAPVSVVADVFRVPRGGTTGIDVATSPYFVGSSAGAQLLTALGANTSLDRVQTFKRLVEFGDRTASNNRTTFRVAGSYNHDFSDTLSLRTSAVYGITTQLQTNTGDFSIPNFRNAVTIESDGRGGYRCVNAQARIEGCLPINPFGTTDSLAGRAGITGISPQAAKYLLISTGQTGEIKQFVANTVLSGELPISISDKPVTFAAGLEYRKEQAVETPDSFRQLGLSRDLQISAIAGQFDVKEAFAEIEVPVAPWLILSAAGRVGDYSTVGTNFTYRFGLNAPVMDALRFRASYSSSVRAPNINDLFSNGITSVAGTNTDVCNGVTAATAGNIATNCRSIAAINTRITNVGSFTLVNSEANNTRLVTAGSPSLTEEKADTLTFGAVLTPMRGLSLSVDFFDINIKDGISRLSPDVYVRRCYDVAPTAFDATCGGTLVRDAIDGPILDVRTPAINAASIKTRGIDVELAFTRPGLNISLYANYLDRFDIKGATGVVEQFRGRPQFPKWRLTGNISYDVTDRFNVFSQVRYRSATRAFLTPINLTDDLNNMKAVTYVDLRLNYKLTDSISAYIGSNNLFDVQPDINPRDPAVGTNTEPRAYDVVGRQYFAGVKFKF